MTIVKSNSHKKSGSQNSEKIKKSEFTTLEQIETPLRKCGLVNVGTTGVGDLYFGNDVRVASRKCLVKLTSLEGKRRFLKNAECQGIIIHDARRLSPRVWAIVLPFRSDIFPVLKFNQLFPSTICRPLRRQLFNDLENLARVRSNFRKLMSAIAVTTSGEILDFGVLENRLGPVTIDDLKNNKRKEIGEHCYAPKISEKFNSALSVFLPSRRWLFVKNAAGFIFRLTKLFAPQHGAY